MKQLLEKLNAWSGELQSHRVPGWDTLPDIDLYMDQVITYMERQMKVFMNEEKDKIITPSMVNNYVKDKLIPRPVQKKYSKEHLGYLLAVCMLKQVLPIGDIAKLLDSRQDKMGFPELYDSFCHVQNEALQAVSQRIREASASSEKENSYEELAMLALKLVAEANAGRIAAERILYLLEQQKVK